jgi:pentatricopeptide repeat protein
VFAILRASTKDQPTVFDRWLSGEIALQHGRAAEAVDLIADARRTIVAGNSNWYLASAVLALALVQAGRTEEAMAVFEEVVRAGRGESLGQPAGRLWMSAAMELARLRLSHGDVAGARQLVDDLDRLLALADPAFPLRRSVDSLRQLFP